MIAGFFNKVLVRADIGCYFYVYFFNQKKNMYD